MGTNRAATRQIKVTAAVFVVLACITLGLGLIGAIPAWAAIVAQIALLGINSSVTWLVANRTVEAGIQDAVKPYAASAGRRLNTIAAGLFKIKATIEHERQEAEAKGGRATQEQLRILELLEVQVDHVGLSVQDAAKDWEFVGWYPDDQEGDLS